MQGGEDAPHLDDLRGQRSTREVLKYGRFSDVLSIAKTTTLLIGNCAQPTSVSPLLTTTLNGKGVIPFASVIGGTTARPLSEDV